MPMILFGDWKSTLASVGTMRKNSKTAVDRAIKDEAFLFQRRVVETFRKQGAGGKKWPRLNPITLALRRGASVVGGPSSRGSKPLIRTGSLRASIKTRKVTSSAYFVGVHRTAGTTPATGGKGATPLVNVASIHETGMVVIPITDKMRRYFRYLYWKRAIPFPWPPARKRYILIPRRSFIRDTMEEFEKGFKGRMLRRYASYLSGGGAIKLA